MALDLAKGVGQRPALDHEAIQAHPGGRAVHAGVAVHQDRPGGGVLGQRQGLGDEASPEGSSPGSLPT